MIERLQRLLEAAFPPPTDAQVIRGVREGVLLADAALDNEPFLKTVVGQDLRGHLRRAGMLFRLHDLCQVGDLPFEANLTAMPRGNWHWLEMKSGLFTAHLCRTESRDAYPDDTPTRQDERLSNQPSLFDEKVVPMTATQYFTWLTFGLSPQGGLQHLCWAMPQANQASWLAHINLPRKGEAVAPTPVSEVPEQRLKLRFREHIEESLAKKPDEKSE